jgi:hypothetical protein
MQEPNFVQFLFQNTKPAALGMADVVLERRALGEVQFADGRVYACDPLVPMDTMPLAYRLVPGSYEIVLFVLAGVRRMAPAEHVEENAAAALICGAKPPVRWQLASREGGSPDAAAYGVDSGTGCFMGSGAVELVLDGQKDTGQSIMHALGGVIGAIVNLEGESVAVFQSGIGDGIYDTWLGYDSDGEVVMILTDFQVVESEEHVASVHAGWDARTQKKWWEFWK